MSSIKLSQQAKRLKDFYAPKKKDRGEPEKSNAQLNLPPNYYDRHVEALIADFNSRGIIYTDIPEINRRKADRLDKEMTAAANRGDRKAFLTALRQWRHCFN